MILMFDKQPFFRSIHAYLPFQTTLSLSYAYLYDRSSGRRRSGDANLKVAPAGSAT
jgi:hypothetical protein